MKPTERSPPIRSHGILAPSLPEAFLPICSNRVADLSITLSFRQACLNRSD